MFVTAPSGNSQLQVSRSRRAWPPALKDAIASGEIPIPTIRCSSESFCGVSVRCVAGTPGTNARLFGREGIGENFFRERSWGRFT